MIKARTLGRIVVGAAINLGAIIAAALVLSVTGVIHTAPALAVVFAIGLALVASNAVYYFLLVMSLRQQFEDELVEDFETEADQPRRFNDVNFR